MLTTGVISVVVFSVFGLLLRREGRKNDQITAYSAARRLASL